MSTCFNSFENLKVLVLGFARSGYSISKFLINKGASILIHSNGKDEEAKVEEMQERGVKFNSDINTIDLFKGAFDLIVKSPGIPYSHPLLQQALNLNIPIYTDIEILHSYLPRTIGITGSNGKTTTTSLIEELMQTTFPHSFACGNIGKPIADILMEEELIDNLVIELSSFQLEGTVAFRPDISVLLNIAPAHLDFHKDLHHYVQAKSKVTKNQLESDFVIYNVENPYTKEIAEKTKATAIPFSVRSFLQFGASVKEQWIYYDGQKLLPTSELSLPGEHNLENILASISVAKLSGVSNENIIRILKTFSGVEHRLQFVGEINKRKYYNDSKATNTLATETAVNSFKQKPILIAGGLDRENSFEELMSVFEKCKNVLLIGQSANRMYQTAQEHNLTNVFISYDLPRAITKAQELSSPQDVILLSPACASWDQYSSFEERGNHFIKLIKSQHFA